MYVNYITSVMNVNSRPHRYVTLTPATATTAATTSRGRSTRSSTCAWTRSPRRPAANPSRSTSTATRSTSTRRSRRSSTAPSGSATATTGTSTASARPRAGRTTTFRVSFDTASLKFMTLRAMYENSARELVDLDTDAIAAVGHQPALRFYDEAARNRDRFTAHGRVQPDVVGRRQPLGGVRQGRLQGRRPDAGVRSAEQQEHGVHGRRRPTRRTRRSTLAPTTAGRRSTRCRSRATRPAPGAQFDRPEPQLDADQRREREHVHALPQPQQADREDRHAPGLRLQQLGPGVRPRRAAHPGARGDGARAVHRAAERDQHVDST